MRIITAVALAAGALLAAGCGSDTGTAAKAPGGEPTEASLRMSMDAEYHLMQQGDWSADYDQFLSQQCKGHGTRDDYTKAMKQVFAGRDLSGPQQYQITMNPTGTAATVVVTSHDGKGNMHPVEWTLTDGRWLSNDC
ncbi:hypothetical protein [Speluncibacter jeojiensis]|uniref:DUF4878 domain-containing protein n=1 Tax=Speluncibacter jeojiensis TaxID=2710754 RepID=A0A9X4RC25_9ACTN|nr:hypothetical protein [Corynebacteriales bacterium D3-21]